MTVARAGKSSAVRESLMCVHCGETFALVKWEDTVERFTQHPCAARDGFAARIRAEAEASGAVKPRTVEKKKQRATVNARVA